VVGNLGFSSSGGPGGKQSIGPERTLLRLAILAVVIVVTFVAMFSRLWFLQVLATEDYQQLARENRVRLVYTEPPRGRILDRNGEVLVDNRPSTALTVNRQLIDTPEEQEKTLTKLTRLLVPKEPDLSKKKKKQFRKERRRTFKDLERRLNDVTVSPYKPVAVAYDVDSMIAIRIRDNAEDYEGVGIEELPVRVYPQGKVAPQILGYVGEISQEDLKTPYFARARPKYRAGDIVGKLGLERSYDRQLRGLPGIQRYVVNSAGEPIGPPILVQAEQSGRDLVLSVDAEIQKLTEKSLENGILAARNAGYEAPDGGVVVMDPNDGGVVAMASFPTYDPALLSDGFSNKDARQLGWNTDDGSDDAMINRASQAAVPPGSTFKVVTAGAAIANGLTDPYESIPCPGSYPYKEQTFANWTSADFGSVDLARSLTISCDTYYYELGKRLEEAYGPPSSAGGDGTEKFQKYMRLAGFGHPTGLDIAEASGRVPDEEWYEDFCPEVNPDLNFCRIGWLPGYTINMSIGQGDLTVSPLQMAVTLAAIVNGGNVVQPRLGWEIAQTNEESGDLEPQKSFKAKVRRKLPLDETTLSQMRAGLEGVTNSGEGTATSAFTGYPMEQYPVAGKTGTAQIGDVDSGKNFAWFISYAPADDPEYVIAVYIEKAGHGGESAAPVARQIYEGIFGIDEETDVHLGRDASG
jgi:penicillin-binding protein 2